MGGALISALLIIYSKKMFLIFGILGMKEVIKNRYFWKGALFSCTRVWAKKKY